MYLCPVRPQTTPSTLTSANMKLSSGSICQIAPRASQFVFVFMCILLATIGGNEALHLTGVTTVPDHPNADVLSSFFHELLEEISHIGQFSYNLRMMPSGTKNGGAVGESQPEGLVAEVYNSRADFVIADLEITKEREQFIEFTRPFMRSKLAALVRRTPLPSQSSSSIQTSGATNGASSIGGSDNANKSHHHADDNSDDDGQTSAGASSLSPDTLRALLRKSKRAVVRGSATDLYFRQSKQPYVYHLLPSGVTSLKAGVQMVGNTSDYVLISDSARLDLVAANDCQFKVVTPKEGDPNEIGNDFTLEYAIGFQKDSSFLQQFDLALEQLEVAGKLSALIDQHWTNYCNPKDGGEQSAGSLGDEETNGASSLTPSRLWLSLSATITTLTIIRMLTTATMANALSRTGVGAVGSW